MSAFDPLIMTLARHRIDELVAKAARPSLPPRRPSRTGRRRRAIAERLDS